ncbi:saccharopine dehydrogenase family protein [Salinactinospora qingdaonensis]
MRVLILGGYGAVGARVAAEMRAHGHLARTAGRDPARADVPVDLSRPEARDYQSALAGIDVVVNAAGVEDPDLVTAATSRGVAFVDITATTSYVAALERLTPTAPVLVNVGLAPGVTTLLAAALHRDRPTSSIDVGVILGAGEAHGRAAVAWSYGLLGSDFPDPATGAAVGNLTQGRTFHLPGYGRRRLYRADFCDQHTLTRDLGVAVRSHLALDSRALTTALTLLTRLPGVQHLRLPTRLHLPGRDDWLVVATTATNESRWASGRNQSQATALVASLAATTVTGLAPGVHHLHQHLSTDHLARLPGIHLAGAR